MSDIVFNIVKGAAAEKFRDGAANGICILTLAVEADAALADHAELNALFLAAGNTEATDGSYARKTGLTGTLDVDNANERVDIDIPDQTWTALAGAAIVTLIVAYEEAAADTTRLPLTNHLFAVTPDGSDVTAQFNAAGFYRAA